MVLDHSPKQRLPDFVTVSPTYCPWCKHVAIYVRAEDVPDNEVLIDCACGPIQYIWSAPTTWQQDLGQDIE